MTAFIPSTRVTIQRAELTADSFGDVRPDTTAMSVASGVPAAIVESSQRSHQPVEGRLGINEEFTIRLRPGTDVTENDRLVDERSGAIYQVRTVTHPHAVAGFADVRVVAVRTGAASQPVNG